MSKKLILPEHVQKAREEKSRKEAEDRGDAITINVIVAPSHMENGKFAVVLMHDGFATEAAAQDFMRMKVAEHDAKW